jgi:hypothetical protein
MSSSAVATRGAKTVDEINAAGGRASFVAAELDNPADIRRFAKDVDDIDPLGQQRRLLGLGTYGRAGGRNLRCPVRQ